MVAIPLRGYVVCNKMKSKHEPKHKPKVAIPLRGYVVCNSTPLGMPFWTAPPEGVFVRKMKLGICIGQRVSVLRGLGRWEDFGRRVKGECISEYRRPRGKKLVFKVPSRIPDEDIIALSGNGVPSTKVCRKRTKEGYYTLRKREEMPSPRNKADGGSN